MASGIGPACCDAGVYEAWRRNVPFLYDWLCSSHLEWGSLSGDFLGQRPVSRAAQLRLAACDCPEKLAAVEGLLGSEGAAEADIVSKGGYLRGMMMATRTCEQNHARGVR